MRLGPTAEYLDFGSACLSFQSKKGRLYSSEISNVKLTFFSAFEWLETLGSRELRKSCWKWQMLLGRQFASCL